MKIESRSSEIYKFLEQSIPICENGSIETNCTMNVEELQTNIKDEYGNIIDMREYFKNINVTVATLIRTEDSK